MGQEEKVNILLVDDHPAKLISYEVMLGELNENLIKALSAREAFEHLLKSEIALVLIDVCMPELDGFELAAMIREHPRFKKTAIIFISAIHLADDDRLRGYKMGAVDYMPVPVVPDILRAKVRVFTELYRKTRQLELLNSELERRVAERTQELEASNTQLIDSEARRNIALEAGMMGSWDWDVEHDVHHWDTAHYRIVGADPATFEISADTVRALVRPEDWAKFGDLFVDAQRGRRSFQAEVCLVRRDGETRWCIITAAASYNEAGTLIRLSGVTCDITERKRAEEYHALLAREVDHRAKNALAIVQSIVRLTRAKSIADYTKAVEGRIAALSHAHTLLSDSKWQGAELKSLVQEELAPYQDTNANQFSISGSNVMLESGQAQSLALIMHELATNAAKYGALSSKNGRLAVIWERVGNGIHFTWTETGGPKAARPKREGFGVKVITAAVEGQLRGKVSFDWLELGLRCSCFIPLGTHREKEAVVGNANTPNRLSRPIRGKRAVLLVEDETLVAIMMRDVLSEIGYDTVGPYATVREALAAAQSNSIFAAILDVNLNGESVYEVADLLAAKEIPFFFVTGYGRENIEVRFQDVAVLRKPIVNEELRNALQAAATKRGAAALQA